MSSEDLDHYMNEITEMQKKLSESQAKFEFELHSLESSHQETAKKHAEKHDAALSSEKDKYDNLRLNIITVVNNLNLNEITDLAEFVKKELPVDSHSPIPVRGNPYDEYMRPPTKEEWDKLSKELLDLQDFWNSKRDENILKKKLRTNTEKHLYKVI